MEMLYFLFIGGSGSGKTVATCNMQHTLTRKGGVKVRRGSKDIHFFLTSKNSPEIQKFKQMYQDMLDGTLPIGTTEPGEYSFVLTRENQGICRIEMVDYRGAFRDDPAAPKVELDAFSNMIRRAAILVYILPGDILEKHQQMLRMEKKNDTASKLYRTIEIEVSEEVGHIKTTMEALQEGEQKRTDRPPLLLYVTKSDQMAEGTDVMAALEKFVKEQNLFFQGTKILGCQSTLGPHIKIDESASPHGILDGLEPEGFEIPILLSAAYVCSQSGKAWCEAELKRLNEELEQAEEDQLEEAGKKVSFLPFIRKKEIENRDRLVKELGRRIQDLRSSIEAVPGKDQRQGYAADILAYIKDGGFPTLYIDENGCRREDIGDLLH